MLPLFFCGRFKPDTLLFYTDNGIIAYIDKLKGAMGCKDRC